MKKLTLSCLAILSLAVIGGAYHNDIEEDEYLVEEYGDEEFDTDDDYCSYTEETDDYLVQCVEGGKCPREMVERLRREKQKERARLRRLNGEEVDDEEEDTEEDNSYLV